MSLELQKNKNSGAMINLLKETIDDASYILMEIIETDQRESLLADYIGKWECVADQASDLDSLFLQDSCALYAEALGLLAEPLSDEHWEVLNEWHNLIVDFIDEPNKENATSLINLLKNKIWDEPLLDNDADDIMELFFVTSEVICEDASVEITDVDLEVIQEAIPEDSDSVEAIKKAIETASDLLMEIIESDVRSELFADYIGKWEEISESSSNSMFFQDISALYAESVGLLQDDVSDDHWELLSEWHNLAVDFIDEPSKENAIELVNILKNEAWSVPFDEDDAKDMIELFFENNEEPAIEEILNEEPEEIIDSALEVVEDMGIRAVIIEDASTLLIDIIEADAEARILLFAEYSGKWEELSELCGQSDDIFLQDVFALYVENIINLSEQDDIPDGYWELLSDWHNYVTDFFDTENQENTVNLIDLLKNELWSNPLSDEDAVELLNSATPEKSPINNENIGTISNRDYDNSEIEQLEFIAPSAAVPSLVEMIRGEFVKVGDEIAESLANFQGASLESYLDSLESNDFYLENIDKAAQTVGLNGLSYVFKQILFNVTSRPQNDHNFYEECNLFGLAIILIKEYLGEVNNGDRVNSLIKHLSAKGWRRPLAVETVDTLRSMLLTDIVENEKANIIKKIALVEHVSLAVPSDVNVDLLESLLSELPGLTENFSVKIRNIIAGDTSSLLDAQRIAHTLKGSGNIIGIVGISTLTHHLEDIFEALTNANALPIKALADVLIDASDCISAMSDALRGDGDAPEDALSVLQSVLDWDYEITINGVPETDIVIERTEVSQDVVKEEVGVEKQAQATMQVSIKVIEDMMQIVGENSSLNEQVRERFLNLNKGNKALREIIDQINNLSAEFDRLINIQNYASRSSSSNNESGFDSLEMEQYNEFHTCASKLAELTADAKEMNVDANIEFVGLKNLLVEQDAIQKENQEIVQKMQLVPASKIVQRCERIVRQACKMINKDVDMRFHGVDTLVDNEALNDLADPLMHLLRNSVDHGIEDAETRGKAGKPEKGLIDLYFSKQGSYTSIICKDDGGGLNTDRIREKAIEKGIIDENVVLSPSEINQLILTAGFSTKESATQVSGRGIGMDAIKNKISSMKGSMSMSSEQGLGMSVEILIPMTQIATQAILVKVGNQVIAVAEHGVKQIHAASEGRFISEDDELFYLLGDNQFPVSHLMALIGGSFNYDMDKRYPAISIKGADGHDAVVLIDEVLGAKNVLIKSIGDFVPYIPGVIGGVILGSGNVSAAVDLPDLVARSTNASNLSFEGTDAFEDKRTRALVIDDSLSARKAAAQLLSDSGYDVDTAIDGLDAIDKIEKRKPDVMLVDMEMPRMNGLELTAHVRGRGDMNNTPIIMITSRSTDKHREDAKQAGVDVYLTKPFSEDDLIENINKIIDERKFSSR